MFSALNFLMYFLLQTSQRRSSLVSYKDSVTVLPMIAVPCTGGSVGTKQFHRSCLSVVPRSMTVMNLTDLSSDVGNERF